MRLVRVTIQNYKSVPPNGVVIEFRERFVVLIGKNNAGKSNILEAVEYLFGYKNPRYVSFPTEVYNPTASLDLWPWVTPFAVRKDRPVVSLLHPCDPPERRSNRGRF